MALSKDVIMQNMQRFGGAMYTPVILFAFFGLEDSRHAVGLRMDNGAELLIHIGVDTVKLEGKGFELLVKMGESVKAGAPLVKFDRDVIHAAGYQDTVIMAVTNSAEYPLMKKTTGMDAKAGETPVLTF